MLETIEPARSFAHAIEDSDHHAARACCARDAWPNLKSLYRQLGRPGANVRLSVIGVLRGQCQHRMAVSCAMHYAPGRARIASLLVEHDTGKLISWTKSKVYLLQYLAGRIPANLSLDRLESCDRITHAANALRTDLHDAAAGDTDARQRLHHLTNRSRGCGHVVSHLQLRSACGERLRIIGARRVASLRRAVVQAELVTPAGEAHSTWLYADGHDPIDWFASSAMFHMGTLIGQY